MAQPDTSGATHSVLYYRHRLPVRIMHWINVVCLTILFMSGLNIFNAHPALNWGKSSYDGTEPLLEIGAKMSGDRIIGVTKIGGREFETTNKLGAFFDASGEANLRAFPGWITVPSTQWLSMARQWHFFFAWLFVANGVAYVLYALFSGHLKRDLLPTRAELRRIGGSIADHLRLRHPTGAAAARYNVLQNIAYLVVIFGLLPLVIVAGMAMSPRLDAVFPGWVELLGGRQSARSLHFLAASGLLLFVLVHLFEVLVNGAWNQIRSMLTGWYALPAAADGPPGDTKGPLRDPCGERPSGADAAGVLGSTGREVKS